MKRTKARRGLGVRLRAALGRLLQPYHSLPCVGLIVLGGCLTMIAIPDEAPSTAPGSAKTVGLRAASGLPMIVIDPGHGGRDEGTKWFNVAEKDMTLDVAMRTERLFKSAGYPTMLTRRDNRYISLEERVRMANQIDDALFVSIHFNSDSASPASSGIETYFAREKAPPDTEWTWVGVFNKPEPLARDTSEDLAGAIQASIANRTEAKNRGIRSANFYVVHHNRHPAVLVEGGFLSNTFEIQLLANAEYRELLAQGIVEGVMSYQKTHQRPNRPAGAEPRLAVLDRR